MINQGNIASTHIFIQR